MDTIIIMNTEIPDNTTLFAVFDSNTNELFRLLTSFSEDEINTIPFINSWTAAQIAEHITRSNVTIIQSLQVNGEPSARQPDERVQELKDTFLDFSIQLKSPDFILPTQDIYAKESLIAELERSIRRLREVSLKANFYEALNHPAFGEITKLEIFHFVIYHTQRHIHQLKKIYTELKGHYDL